MKQRESGASRPFSEAGFTMMEFILVIGITGILVLGFGAIIEVPRQAAEAELSDQPRLSDVDRATRWLDDDVRFAKDVAVPAANRLEVTRRDAQVVVYEWGGSNGPLVRTAPEGTADVIPAVARVQFALGESMVRVDATDGDVAETVVEMASFDAFTLKPGYTLSSLLRGILTLVNVLVGALPVQSSETLGLVFVASGLEDDDGHLESIRLRLRRSGTSGVKVSVYEALGSPVGPDRSRPIASVFVQSSALPGSMSEFTIPVSASRALRQGQKYFVEIVSDGGPALELESHVLSLVAAATATTTGLLRSSNGGRNYSPAGGSLDASQTVFSVKARKTEKTSDGAGRGFRMIPTSVNVAFKISTPAGVTSIDTSFPIENNVALVNR